MTDSHWHTMISGAHRTYIPVYRDDIQLSDEQIVSRYIGVEEFPCVIRSPLRDDDKTPSFSFFYYGDKLFWKDFGTGEKGNAVGLMAKLWKVTYDEALLKIKLDDSCQIPRFSLIRRYKGKIHVTSKSTISVKVRAWREWDKDYWQSYGISLKFCKWCNVYPISHAFFTKEIDGKPQTITVPMDKYAYAYFEWKDGKESIKLYQPFSSSMKWLSKHDQSVWDLWKQAFKWADEKSDDAVIITSSRKDAMCLWENLKIPAMSLQGEGYIPKPQVMQQVISRFKNVYLWYDNDFKHKDDNPGQDNAQKIITEYPSIRNICIPTLFQCKDPSDFVKKYGVQALRDLWYSSK